MSGFRLKPPPPIGRKFVRVSFVPLADGAVSSLQQRQPLPVRLSRISGGDPPNCFYMWVLTCPLCGETHYLFLAGCDRGEDPREVLTGWMWMPCEDEKASELTRRGGFPEETLGFPVYDADPARTRRILRKDSLPVKDPPVLTSDDEEPVCGTRALCIWHKERTPIRDGELFISRDGKRAGRASIQWYSQPEQETTKTDKEGGGACTVH